MQGSRDDNHKAFGSSFIAHELQPAAQSHAACLGGQKLLRPINIQATAPPDQDRRPRGRRTGSAPFFDEAGRLIEKSRPRPRGQFRIGLGMSSLVTFFAPKKVTRAPARKRPMRYRYAMTHREQQGLTPISKNCGNAACNISRKRTVDAKKLITHRTSTSQSPHAAAPAPPAPASHTARTGAAQSKDQYHHPEYAQRDCRGTRARTAAQRLPH